MKINENSKIIVWMKENKKVSVFVLAGLLLLVLAIPTNNKKEKDEDVLDLVKNVLNSIKTLLD